MRSQNCAESPSVPVGTAVVPGRTRVIRKTPDDGASASTCGLAPAPAHRVSDRASSRPEAASKGIFKTASRPVPVVQNRQ